MPRSDRIKEELGWLKIVLAVSVAVDVSPIGWLLNIAAIRRFKALEKE